MKRILQVAFLFCALNVVAEDIPKPPEPQQSRELTVSNVLYVIKYDLHSTNFYSVPLTYPLGQPHYSCTATISNGTNKVAVLETEWTKKGCWEDSPMMLIGRVLVWERYPNNSGGTNLHWVCKGPAMWIEKD